MSALLLALARNRVDGLREAWVGAEKALFGVEVFAILFASVHVTISTVFSCFGLPAPELIARSGLRRFVFAWRPLTSLICLLSLPPFRFLLAGERCDLTLQLEQDLRACYYSAVTNSKNIPSEVAWLWSHAVLHN